MAFIDSTALMNSLSLSLSPPLSLSLSLPFLSPPLSLSLSLTSPLFVALLVGGLHRRRRRRRVLNSNVEDHKNVSEVLLVPKILSSDGSTVQQAQDEKRKQDRDALIESDEELRIRRV